MLKRLLLLLLCIPLGIVLYQEGKQLFQHIAAASAPARLDKRLKDAKKAVNDVKELEPELQTVVSGEEPGKGQAKSSEKTAAAVGAYSTALADTRFVLKNPRSSEELKTRFDAKHPFRLWAEVVKLENDLKDDKQRTKLASRLEDLKKLKGQLEAYKEGFSKALEIDGLRAEVEWYDLEANHLKKLKKPRGEAFTKEGYARPSVEIKEFKKDLATALAKLCAFQTAHPELYKDRVAKELVEWTATKELVDLMDPEQKPPTTKTLAGLGNVINEVFESEEKSDAYIRNTLAGLGTLCQKKKVSKELKKLIERAAQAVCKVYLPQKLNLDDKVGLQLTQKNHDPALRKDVTFRQKGTSTKKCLGDEKDADGYWKDEKLLKGKNFEFLHQGQSRSELKWVGVGRTPAVRAYNEHRSTMEWTVAKIKDLTKICEDNKDHLAEPLRRLQQLAKAVEKLHECELFVEGR